MIKIMTPPNHYTGFHKSVPFQSWAESLSAFETSRNIIVTDSINEKKGEERIAMEHNRNDDVRWERTHFMDRPEKRVGEDRRKTHCFIGKDRRSGIVCRRKERMRAVERRIALSKVTFYPDYYPVR